MTRFVSAAAIVVAIVGVLLAACGSANVQTGPPGEDENSTTTVPEKTASTSSLAPPPTTEQQSTTTEPQIATTTSSIAPTTTTEVLPLDPKVEAALGVAEEFMAGFAARDMTAIEETSVEGHVFGFVVDAFDLFPDEFAWLEAIGWEITVDECSVTNPDLDNLKVTCTVTHENDWSRALSMGPYEGEFFVSMAVPGHANWVYEDRDRPVVTTRAFAQFPTFFFRAETWNPFIEWVEANHPADLAVMLSAIPPSDIQFLPANPALTPDSIELWKVHTEEFVVEATLNT